jgi:hypothetical protein
LEARRPGRLENFWEARRLDFLRFLSWNKGEEARRLESSFLINTLTWKLLFGGQEAREA